MIYQEHSIKIENLEKFLTNLDSDEGIRIDNKLNHIFINKTSKRYCINISNDGKDEFIYKNTVKETIDFVNKHITQESGIFSY